MAIRRFDIDSLSDRDLLTLVRAYADELTVIAFERGFDGLIPSLRGTAIASSEALARRNGVTHPPRPTATSRFAENMRRN